MSARLPVHRQGRPYEMGDLSHQRPGPYEHEDALRELLGADLHDIASEVGTKPRTLYWWVDRHEPGRPGPARRLGKMIRVARRDHCRAADACLGPLAVLVREVLPVLGVGPDTRAFAGLVADLAGLDVVDRDPGSGGATVIERVRQCVEESADVMRAAMAGTDGWTAAEVQKLDREVQELCAASHDLVRQARRELREQDGEETTS